MTNKLHKEDITIESFKEKANEKLAEIHTEELKLREIREEQKRLEKVIVEKQVQIDAQSMETERFSQVHTNCKYSLRGCKHITITTIITSTMGHTLIARLTQPSHSLILKHLDFRLHIGYIFAVT